MSKFDDPAWRSHAGQVLAGALGAMHAAGPEGHTARHQPILRVERAEPAPPPAPPVDSRLDPRLEALIGARVEKLLGQRLEGLEQTLAATVAEALAKASGGSR